MNKFRNMMLLLVAGCLGAPPSWAQSSPAAVVNAFYSDWLKLTQAKQGPPQSQAFAAESKRFEPTLFRLVTKTLQMEEKASPADGVVGYDEDPFFHTQSRAVAFHLGPVSRHGANAAVPVYWVEGLDRNHPSKPILAGTVQLAQSNGAWRITDVLYPGGAAGLRASSLEVLKGAH